MFNRFKKHPVLYISFIFLSVFSLLIFAFTKDFYESVESISLFIRNYLGRFYLYLGLGCVLLLLAIALSPLGRIKLGKSNDKPEHSLWAWIAMLYSAGMGAGILLRAVQEPVYMKMNPPLASALESDVLALQYTFYQWGFTAWAFYGLFAMIIGYYLFTKNKRVAASISIEDTISHKLFLNGIDILTIITTVFGLIAAVGLGTTQINGGLSHLYQTELDVNITILITLIVCIMAFISVWKGVNRGIKIISKINITIAIIILCYVIAFSDIGNMISLFFKALYNYIIDFIPLSIAYKNYDPGLDFLTDWTYYYWAFWLAWAPFTGIFIARISKGRTFRELLIGVLLIPSLGTFIWFSAFGSSAFSMIDSWNSYNNEFGNVFTSIFKFFELLPFNSALNTTTIILLISFLVTSVDSAVFVLSMFTDKGNKIPNKRHRILWSVIITVAVIALILLGNAKPEIDVLIALQKLLIITSLPFALYMVFMIIVFLLDIKSKKVAN